MQSEGRDTAAELSPGDGPLPPTAPPAGPRPTPRLDNPQHPGFWEQAGAPPQQGLPLPLPSLFLGAGLLCCMGRPRFCSQHGTDTTQNQGK